MEQKTDAEYRQIFKKKLIYYMEKFGKTQADLINDLGLSQSTVSSWCTGIKLPRMGKIQMLADYFGIEKSDLIEEKPDNTVKDNTYYLNDETAELAQFAFQNPEYKVLFDASRKTKPEDIKFVTDMINRVNGTGSDVDG